MKKIFYLTYAENLFSPLLRRQVVELLDYIQEKGMNNQITLVSFFPWYWLIAKKGQLRLFRKYISGLRINSMLMPLPYPFPIPAPFWKFYKNIGWRPYSKFTPIMTSFFLLIVFPVLIYFYFFKKVKIFHCRSYPISFPVMILKKILPNIRFIFDPRSDYPEENVTSGSWRRTDLSFRFWKWAESQLLCGSDVTICISEIYKEHFRKNTQNFQYKIIPNNVNISQFYFDNNFRKEYRLAMGLNNKVIFCYLGNMLPYGWNRPGIYAKVILSYRDLQKDHIFLFLVPKRANPLIKQVFTDYAIDDNEYVLENPPYSEVSQYLSIADYGLLYLDKRSIRLGTKIAEYATVGIASIVNSNVESAVSFVSQNGCGHVIDIGLGELDSQSCDINEKLIEANNNRELIEKVGRFNFSNEIVSDKYLAIYESF